jgi:YegS/Rv2252/BmrU family lipid kinase
MLESRAVSTVVIANPKSANGALGARWSQVAATLHGTLGAFEERLTTAPREATKLARDAIANGAERVIAVGGDGTIHEVANGFFPAADEQLKAGTAAQGGAKTVLGIIPFGTGGDFRKTLGIDNDVASAARVIQDGRDRSIDVGRLTYTTPSGGTAQVRFVNIASFGISGLVDSIVNQSSKALGGKVTFLLATLRATARWKNQRVRLRFNDGEAGEDDERTGLIQTVAVANGRYFGGGMKIAPDAIPDDGAFDVVTIGDLGTLEVLLSGPRVYKGTHLTLPKVSVRRAHKVHAEAVDPHATILLDVDGEQPGHLPATFDIERSALTVRAPAVD